MITRAFFKSIFAIVLATQLQLAARAAEKSAIRVLVWDEQQPEQKTAYDGHFLGETIAAHLKSLGGIEVKSVNLKSPEQGLDSETLENTDVLIWWGHVKHDDVTDAHLKAVVDRVLAGKLHLIALHSAHYSRPFMSLMHERARQDALKQITEADRAAGKIDFSAPLKRGSVKVDSPLTPRVELIDGKWKLFPPICVFPSWRADGAPGHMTTLMPEHPIAHGLPLAWDVKQTEMYSEPFHVPKPDAVIFQENWDKGEFFRSGCLWQVGKGQVFYFRPGHESYPVFKQPETLRVLENAVRCLGK